jgi:hypothetical protein
LTLLLIGASTALAGTPRPQQIVTTQRAVVAAQAFKPDDPVMKSPQAAKVLSATMVSAEFKNVPALKAFAELAQKSGYTIEPYDGGGTNPTRYGNVTATITNQPFWFAVREVCTRGNVGLYYYGGEEPDKIQLMPSNYGQQHMLKAAASIQGPYMTIVTYLTRVNSVAMGTPDKVDRKVNLQIQTFAEPKARPMHYSYQPVIDECVDDNGNSMIPDAKDEGGRQQHMQSSRGVSFNGHVSLPYPTTNPGKRIARLRGHIDAKVQLSSEPWEIADPLKASETSKTVGGKKYTFKSLTKNDNGQYNLQIIMYRGDNEDQRTFQQTAFSVEPVLKLTDAGNTRYQSHSSGGSSDGEKVTRHFTFARRGSGGRASAGAAADAPDPTKLVIELATTTQDVAIPFELVDLPLP